MSYTPTETDLCFGAPLSIEDIDISGWTGYTVSKGKVCYFVLQREIKNDSFTGRYIRKKISKEKYEQLKKEKNA